MRPGLTRRDALRLGGLAALGVTAAGCGIKGKKVRPPTKEDVANYWSGRRAHRHLVFANWPYYMDPKKPELNQYTKRTGVRVEYKEVIQDSVSYFAKVRPLLAADQYIGADLMVITNGAQFSQLVDLGYLAPLDHGRLPNFAKHAAAQYKKSSFDPGNLYSIPWASGMTGIAYNPKFVDEEITSIESLWDPKYKGKVGMMSDTQELGNFGLFAVGANPEKSTRKDWREAAAKLQKQRDAGIVRKYYDQAYIDALGKGDVWLTMAWSGDVFQRNLEGGNLKFVLPEEGGTLWTDNLMIPKTAHNPVDAIELMDYFYEPQIAGSLAEYINFITPVPAAREAIEEDAKSAAKAKDRKVLEEVAKSPLVFPTSEDYKNTSGYRVFENPREQQAYESVFQPIVTS